MNELVKVRKDDVFTTSLIIAEKTGNQHKGLVQLIRKYEKNFNKFGLLHFKCIGQKGKKGYKTWYDLNEQQATLLISFLDNTSEVVEFKVNLVDQFYKMKNFILNLKLNQQNEQWKLTREQGKITRKLAMETVEELICYARQHGSTGAKWYYSNISKLVNKLLGIEKGQRNGLNIMQLHNLNLLENLIKHTIDEEIEKNTCYKEIYKICKTKCNQFMTFIFVDYKTTQQLVVQ